jgi:hypothetical protein
MRTKVTILGLTLVAALAIGTSGASAAKSNIIPGEGAYGNAFTNWAPIQEGNGDCGEDLYELPEAGIVRFTRTGNLLRLAVTFYDGLPNTRYNVDVAGEYCYYIGRAGSFYTDAYGYAKATVSIAVPQYEDYFFADIDQYGFNSYSNDTPYAYVP